MTVLALGGLTLDDIVVQEGGVHRGTPGGNALYTALGAWLCGSPSALLTFAGSDHPPALLARLEAHGIETRYIHRLEVPSILLWVLYERDGRRQIHYQHRSSRLDLLQPLTEGMLGAALPGSPGAILHIAALPVSLQRPILEQARRLGVPVTVDSIEARGSVGGDLPDYREHALLRDVVAFLPSREEFSVIQGERSESETVTSLMHDGPRALVIKDGARGCVLYQHGRPEPTRVPAFPTTAVDPTGAGDVFCGAFSATLAATGEAVEAALRATVAASFVVEDVGALHLLERPRAEVEARLARHRSSLMPEVARAVG